MSGGSIAVGENSNSENYHGLTRTIVWTGTPLLIGYGAKELASCLDDYRRQSHIDSADAEIARLDKLEAMGINAEAKNVTVSYGDYTKTELKAVTIEQQKDNQALLRSEWASPNDTNHSEYIVGGSVAMMTLLILYGARSKINKFASNAATAMTQGEYRMQQFFSNISTKKSKEAPEAPTPPLPSNGMTPPTL